MNIDWHKKTVIEIMDSLHSDENGLSIAEAKLRLERNGFNKLPEEKIDSLFAIFLRQFQSPLIYILVLASAFVFVIGEVVDGSIIVSILIFNSIVGTIQEGKARNTLLALKNFVETKATVIRDEKEMIIPDYEVVTGDIIILQEGAKIPADARIIDEHNLKVNESALTGESKPVHKINEVLDRKENTIQHENMVYKATNVVSGNGKAIVVETGEDTLIGSIAKKISKINTEIPLKNNLKHLSRIIILMVVLVTATVFTIGIMRGESLNQMFKTVVAIAVSIVPEGLPVVVTLILAMGVWRMSKRNALVKKLQAVESLGQAGVIAVDKTGTITKNEIIIQKIYTNGKTFHIGGVGYEPKGHVTLDGQIIDALNHPELLLTGKIAALCASARVMYQEEEKLWKVAGDPTEAAMLILSQKLGFHKKDLEKESGALAEIPFDYSLKYHAVLNKDNDKNMINVVGAPEVILELSSKIWQDGESKDMTNEDRERLNEIFYEMSQEGLRVVAIAIKPEHTDKLDSRDVKELSFVGFYGMEDAIRPEVSESIQQAISAGIKVVMITGDYKLTALAIGKEAGIWRDKDIILTGEEIDKMSEEGLAEKLDRVSIFARVNPEYKMKIIEAYRSKGIIIAMTGDGVNDAPALVSADLGVSMGKIGTEVAKEASDIVLLDDNFSSIVSAIEEGRSIYKTIKKVILYLLAASVGEVVLILGALILGYPLPILPIHIIWLNFVTDGFLDVSLGMEPKEKHLLSDRFEKPKKYLLDKHMTERMILMSSLMALGTLYMFVMYYEINSAKAWTVSLTTMAAFQWFNAWNCRSDTKSIFRLNPLSNKFLMVTTIVIISTQIFAIYSPLMQKFLQTVPLNAIDWIRIVTVAAFVIIAEEIRKLIRSAQKQRVSLKITSNEI